MHLVVIPDTTYVPFHVHQPLRNHRPTTRLARENVRVQPSPPHSSAYLFLERSSTVVRRSCLASKSISIHSPNSPFSPTQPHRQSEKEPLDPELYQPTSLPRQCPSPSFHRTIPIPPTQNPICAHHDKYLRITPEYQSGTSK
ncbi:hypothetical protein JAAARDRAFT_345967 [Jaapia argillacea MUCL 33604]|uniref:Uncharacterized protein n=1 Tax=Jaapia argillacea MUCL 33604 TaxID=933084 RepID=A0A067PVF0_9AGAM|nr:hypothetical protein JAAARDRAFT_345967 [Jaapia argillacea MUCL 33604]